MVYQAAFESEAYQNKIYIRSTEGLFKICFAVIRCRWRQPGARLAYRFQVSELIETNLEITVK